MSARRHWRREAMTRLLRGGIGNDKAAGLGPRAGQRRVFQAVDAVAALEIRAEAGTSFFRVRWRRARCGAPRVPARGRRSKPFATSRRRARLSDVAPATSDKHRALIGSRAGDGLVLNPKPDRRPLARLPGAARAYRMLRQQLRISTALLSDVGRDVALYWTRILIESRSRDSQPRARLSDVAPATSDKHRALIGCRAGGGLVLDANPHRKPLAGLPGAARAYRMLRQQLRMSTALLSDVARDVALYWTRILIESRSRDFPGPRALIGCCASNFG